MELIWTVWLVLLEVFSWVLILVVFPSSHSEGTPEVHSFFCINASSWHLSLVRAGLGWLLHRAHYKRGADFLTRLHVIGIGQWLSSPVFYSSLTLTTSCVGLFQSITARQVDCCSFNFGENQLLQRLGFRDYLSFILFVFPLIVLITFLSASVSITFIILPLSFSPSLFLCP